MEPQLLLLSLSVFCPMLQPGERRNARMFLKRWSFRKLWSFWTNNYPFPKWVTGLHPFLFLWLLHNLFASSSFLTAPSSQTCYCWTHVFSVLELEFWFWPISEHPETLWNKKRMIILWIFILQLEPSIYLRVVYYWVFKHCNAQLPSGILSPKLGT